MKERATLADPVTSEISGTLNSTGSTDFTVELFASTDCDPTDHGEGEIFLGSDTVTTDSGGDAAFTITTTTSFAGAAQITATATNPGGSTSEFSACLEALELPTEIFADGFESGDTSAWSVTTGG